jgi:PAS domain S-box-containing protein
MRKTKEHLHNELDEMRHRIAELESLDTKNRELETVLEQQTQDLIKQAKELDCLINISVLTAKHDITLSQFLEEIVHIIPQAWQYPDITCARIQVEDIEFKTNNFKETKWKLASDLISHERKIGALEVNYLEERPMSYEGPFLKSERALLQTIGKLLESFIEHADKDETYLYLASIVESSDDAIIGKTLNGIITSWNRGAEILYGYTPDEIIGHPVSVLIPDDHPDELQMILNRIKLGESIEHFETVRVNKNGERIDVSLTVSPITDSTDNIIGVSAIARDITEHKQAHKTQSLLASIVESSDDAIVGLDLDGIITSWNAGAERMYGYSAEEAIGYHASMLVPPGNPDDVVMYLEKIRAGEGVYHYETVRQKKDGEQIDISLTVSPITDEGDRIVGASVIARDITESKRMWDNMQFYIEEITKSQENERNRIARELHDDTIQELIVLGNELDTLTSKAERLSAEEKKQLDSLWEQTQGIIAGIRHLSQDLRPPTLNRFGLLSSIEWLASKTKERSGITVEVTKQGDPRRSAPEFELLLFRMVQEALNNIWKHSSASEAQVIVEFSENIITITIIDNGHGFQVPVGMGDFAKHGKLGLAGMQERAKLLRGTVSIHSEPDKGTILKIQAPL